MVSLGEFVTVEDGRCGVLVPTPSLDVLVAASFGQPVEGASNAIAHLG
jgi:hypothetical protein